MKFIKPTSRNGVLALNVLLVAILTVIVLVPPSDAQSTNPRAIPADCCRYVAIPAVASGINTGAVYILDTSQQEMAAVAWNQNRNKIMTLGYRNVGIDAQSVPLN